MEKQASGLLFSISAETGLSDAERSESMKRSITLPYAGAHGFYWAANCPLIAFAAVYLQLKGFDTVHVGTVLSLATIIPAFLQPMVATAADRSKRFSIRAYLTALVAVMLAGICVLLLAQPGGTVLLAVFFAVSVIMHLLEPLLNAIASYCFHHNIPLDFGVSRAAGSLCFAISSFTLGYAAKYWGADSLLLICAGCSAGFLACLYTLPHMQPNGANQTAAASSACSLPQFLRKYRRYTMVLVGFFFIAAFHTMTETYLINMMERIGGDSSNVGIALLLANLCEFVVIFFYERFRKLLSNGAWLGLTAVCFAGKALLFHLAPSVPLMYLAQMLQAFTYSFYAPSIVHFANDEVQEADSVKGQSVCVAMFTLGGSLGNYLGGQIIAHASVHAMTFVAFLLALLGASIVLLVVCRKPRAKMAA